MYYSTIFFTNILRILDERNMTKSELSKMSGVSMSFLSDVTTGKGNPSLEVMEKIAVALGVPLSLLLESTDLDKDTLNALTDGKIHGFVLPDGYIRVTAVLPEHQAFIVNKWNDDARLKLRSLPKK